MCWNARAAFSPAALTAPAAVESEKMMSGRRGAKKVIMLEASHASDEVAALIDEAAIATQSVRPSALGSCLGL
jgi:hypothetical protein